VILPSSAVSIAGEGGVVWVALASGGLAEVGQPAPLFMPSSLTLSAPSGASPVVGSPTTLTATVSTPGTVTFYDGSTAISGCTGLSATTTVTCAWSPTTVGARSLSATLTPSNAAYSRSTSPALTLSVAPESTSVTPSFPAGSVASGRVSLPATGSVPGTLTFSSGGSFIPGCVGLAAPQGSATCATSLGAGTHQVTVALAPYSANDAPSSATQRVKVVPRLLSGSVPFARGSSTLDATGRQALARLVRVIAADGYTRVHLVGLGDGGGSTTLARDRAATVAAALRHDLSGVSVSLGSPPRPSAGSRVDVIASL
ncbi:MAG TPA: Ig-like domain repeat protein, partial [Acidimicrobiales bacterium]